MSGKRSRNKGHNWERECATLLKPIFPSAKRKLEYQVEEAKGYDLENTGPFLIQCKRGKKYCSISKIDEPQCEENQMPMLITKGDRLKPVVAMYLEDFIHWTTKVQN